LSIYTIDWQLEISVLLSNHIREFMYISSLLFQVKGDPSGTSFLEKQMKIPDIDPAFEELLNLMMKVEYYW
jgi:hypothetical protein